ncbi:TolC family outer membrane protein [Roseateles violae]|uniref:TolC family outer membrane protein n=1 Tax=Roseateles violae TaxID=3058042 RepID=A0ABT8DT99_9BURK|nr:TolC family outer membrane protein [Pelomonas sp. PFR6]MDN3920278.1 TolC family outer membrane protein [Pelomonas sp. PFR6]
MPAQRPSHPRRPLKVISIALASAFAAAGSGIAHAQSLQEVYEAARAYDATYLAARAQAETAQYRLGQAEALNKPSVGLGASGTLNRTDLPGSVPAPTTSDTLQAGLSGRMSVYNRANTATIEQARRGLGVAEADLQSAEQDLIVRTATAYFDVLAAQDNLTTLRASKAAIGEQLASAKRNFEVGTATITDAREAQARYDLATAQDIGAENDLRVKRVALDQLVGRVGVEPKPLALPVVLPVPLASEADTWVAYAERHPQINKARLGLEVAQLETEKARAQGGVTVDATGTLGAQRYHVGSGPAQSLPGTTQVATLGLQINYPLYTGGLVQNRVKETLALEEKARNDLDFVRRGITEGTRRIFYSVQSLQAQEKALEAAEASSKLALESTQLGYKVGVRVNLDVLNAQTLLYTTQRDLAKVRYDVLVGALRLRQAAGILDPGAINTVNQLLVR